MYARWDESEPSDSDSDDKGAKIALHDPNICFMTQEDERTSRTRRKELWYLDSDCSHHMTGNKELFTILSRIEGGNVSFGGDKKCKIIASFSLASLSQTQTMKSGWAFGARAKARRAMEASYLFEAVGLVVSRETMTFGLGGNGKKISDNQFKAGTIINLQILLSRSMHISCTL
ncbi:uncharacterized protein A4U43_C07F15350 [Asparagus officinalis]|uniref:Retrovirus-related Pol polyprotein from transposon TNT 1-94-like beta-barrel domain-containing protein n=1 Tax=Asparagus officinalis TaxID=4686 RepID=A0A5P1EE40_ASPOF|nr:uncharacterized protein A4U43_C07F15350 [Asparagus officinalis]